MSDVEARAQHHVLRASGWPESLRNGTEMGDRVRDFDWGKTSLGPIASWPQSLRTLVGMVIDNDFPMYIFAGAQNIAIYNDAYSGLVGEMHPAMLGMRSEDIWKDIWDVLEPLVRQAKRGEPVTVSDFPLNIHRRGFPEDTNFSFCYSPIRDDRGEIEGALATLVETTPRILAQRRLELLRDLSLRASGALTQLQVLERMQTLDATADVPFALIYLASNGSDHGRLAGRIGVMPDGRAVADTLPLDATAEDAKRTLGLADDIVVEPIGASERQPAIGILVAGVNPKLRMDDEYREFMTLFAAQIGSFITVARSFEEERSRAESAQVTRTIQKIGLFAESGQQLFWMTKADGWIDWYNQSWYDYTGQTPQEAEGWGWRVIHHPDDVAEVSRRWAESLENRTPFEMTFRLRGKDGRFRWFITRAVPELDDDGNVVRWYGTNTNVDSERRAVTQLNFFSSLGDRLVQTLDRKGTLRALIDGLVPALADWTMINLADETGRLILRAATHRDPEKARLLEPFIDSSYERPSGRSGSVRVFAAAKPEVMESITVTYSHEHVLPEFARVIEALGLTSAIVVPIFTNGKIVGTFHALSSGSDKAYAANDLPFYSEIGRRIGFALQNAEAYEREVRIAHAFQTAALPSTLPAVPGLQFSSLYEPASSDANVGGDFYDAFRLLDGRVVVSIGDVSGSGLAAAATMAALRQSIRAAASINPDPELLLKAADGVFLDANRPPFASAFVAVIDPMTFSIQYASAGHPAPVLRLRDGSLSELGGGDLLLGLSDGDHYGSRNVGKASGARGAALILYTDGLTEASHDLAAGEKRLSAALKNLSIPASASDTAQAIHDAMLPGNMPSHDDVAILAVLFGEPMSEGRRDDILHWRLRSDDGKAAHDVRVAMVRALEQRGLSEADVFSAEMIFAELVGNVVRHAGVEMEIALDLTQEAPVLHVIDAGEGFSLNPKLPLDFYSERGRGLYIVTKLAREFITSPRTLTNGSHARAVLCGRLKRT